MKTKFILSLLCSIGMSLLIGCGISAYAASAEPAIHLDPLMTSAVVFTVKAVVYIVYSESFPEHALFAGVNKEIWTDILKENFYAEQPVLEGVDDWSEWVEYNTINFANIGTDPVVLKNNAVWPIVAVQRTDTAGTIVLDTYDTTTTRVRNLEEIESSYDKLQSVIKQHKQKLALDTTKEAIWNYAPAADAAATPVTRTTGALRTIGSLSTQGKRMQLQDISDMQERFDNLDYPTEGRKIILNPVHRKDLMDADTALFKAFANLKAGEVLPLFGFDIQPYSQTPTYTKTTWVKKAFGAAVDNTNDVPASTVFVKKEVVKIMGDVEMFHKEKEINPEQRANEVGFQMRFKAIPPRQVCIGAIITERA
jgi:hypothetical protein